MAAGDLKTATSLTARILASGQLTATTATTVYTVPASSQCKVASAALCNVTDASVTLSISVVPSGGNVDGTHVVLSQYVLPARATVSQDDVLSMLHGLLLGAGDFISITAGTANAVDYLLTGAVSA